MKQVEYKPKTKENTNTMIAPSLEIFTKNKSISKKTVKKMAKKLSTLMKKKQVKSSKSSKSLINAMFN